MCSLWHRTSLPWLPYIFWIWQKRYTSNYPYQKIWLHRSKARTHLFQMRYILIPPYLIWFLHISETKEKCLPHQQDASMNVRHSVLYLLGSSSQNGSWWIVTNQCNGQQRCVINLMSIAHFLLWLKTAGIY